MRAVLPALQLLILLVQLRQKLIALVRYLVSLLKRGLLDFGGLDDDLRLHAHLHVFVLHDHHSRLFWPRQRGRLRSRRGHVAAVARAPPRRQRTYEFVHVEA